jgi:hypothetical protein
MCSGVDAAAQLPLAVSGGSVALPPAGQGAQQC